MLIWLFPVLFAAPTGPSCGDSCEAVVREVGTQKPVGGLPFRIHHTVVESDADGRLVFDSNRQHELTPILLSPEWRVVQDATTIRSHRPTTIWVAPVSTNALGLYQKKTEVTTHRILREEVEALPGSLQDPLRALQDLPGTARSPMNAGWLLVRGTEPQDSQIDWQGLPLSQLFHLGGIASIFHPQSIGEIHYRPTGWVNRRSSLGGSVSVKAEERAQDARLEIGTDLINSSLFISRPMSSTHSLAATARRSWLRQAIAFTQGTEAAAIAPQFTDWSVGLQGRDSSLMLIGLADGIDSPTADGEQILQVGLAGQLLMGHRRWRNDGNDRLLSALVSREKRSLSEDEETLSLQESTAAHLHFESTYRGESSEFQLGTDLSVGSHAIQYYPQTLKRGLSRAEFFSSASFGKRRRLLLGLRNTHLAVQEHASRIGLDPALRIIEPIWRDLAVQLHLARRHQAPAVMELIGDPEGPYLPLERADELATGLFWLSQNLHASVEVFAKSLSHLAVREEDGTMGRFSGVAYGSESFMHWNSAPFLLRIGGSFSRSLRQESPEHPMAPHLLDPGLQFSVLGGWSNDRGWRVSGRFRYASGVPFLDERPTAFDLLSQQEILLKPTVNPHTNRLPDPYALDIKLSRKSTFKRWRLDAYLDLQNLTNRRVPEPILTGFEEIPVFGFGLPFLPVFGVEGVFWPQGE